MHEKDNVLSVLNDAVHKIEKEIKEKENLIEDLEWDLGVAKDRLEYLKVQLTDIKAHIGEVKGFGFIPVFRLGDKVKIISAMATDWIGKEAEITKVFQTLPQCYELNIGGGHWLHSTLEKIN